MEIKTALGLICYAVMLMNLHTSLKDSKPFVILILANFIFAYVGTQLLFL